LAVATLFAVEGSSYRQPGARLLVDGDGRVLAGAISGGCLEGDVSAHAKGVCESGVPQLLTYDLRDDLESIWGFGAMCDGVAHILVEPLRDGAWLEEATAIRHARKTGALLTVLEGARAGTSSGQSCEPDLIVAAESHLNTVSHTALPSAGTIELDGATVRCFVDPVIPPVSLIIVGAGRGAETFATIAHALGWTVSLIDHRPFVLESVNLPPGTLRFAARADGGMQHISVDERTAVALLTHQFEIDAEWLTRLLPLSLGYIGVLGSRLRARQLVDTLRDQGLAITPRMMRLLHAPIGLDLGGESPESIALAAIAEIESVMHDRPGGPLRERQSPIHTRTPTPHVMP
jgi:xanthine/CO dehydrogenase XdhC/CoxF family maturation factor